MASRKKIHDWDIRKFGEAQHQPACLAGHCSWYAECNTCSYRHQAYLRAKAAGRKYKWPADVKGPRNAGDWDIGKAGNFQKKSSKPFWHEAHHIVPNSELNKALDNVGKGASKGATKLKVREGLIGEKYNLNDKLNMIILPMFRKHSRALGLPRHRRTFAVWSHRAYSNHVSKRLDEVMQPMKDESLNCELEEYQAIRGDIEAISNDLYPKIRDAGDMALDDLKLKMRKAAL